MNSVWVDLMGAEVKYYQGKYRTRVIEAGQGEPLILIHGIGGHAEAYSRNVMRLAKDFRVLAIDLVYHGYSEKEPRDGKLMEHYAAQVIDLLDVIGVRKAYIEGESLGGWLCMWLGVHHPDRIHKLVLNTAAGVTYKPGMVNIDNVGGRELLSSRSIAAVQDPNAETIRKRLEWLMASPDRVTDELVDIRLKIYSDPAAQQSLTYVFSNAFGQGTSERYLLSEEQVSSIDVPCLVLWTDKNPGQKEDVGERLHSLIKGSEYVLIKDAAHWPQWEHPEEHDEAVLSFLKAPVKAAAM